MRKMERPKGPRAKIVKPFQEYEDYEEFCKENNIEPVDRGEFYKGAYILAIRSKVTEGKTDDKGIASFCMGGVTMFICEVGEDDKALVMSLFRTEELDKFAEEEKKETADPTSHIG